MAKNYSNGNSEKEVHLLERRLIDLSRVAYRRDIITFTDFLNLPAFIDRKSTRLNSSHITRSRMPSSA